MLFILKQPVRDQLYRLQLLNAENDVTCNGIETGIRTHRGDDADLAEAGLLALVLGVEAVVVAEAAAVLELDALGRGRVEVPLGVAAAARPRHLRQVAAARATGGYANLWEHICPIACRANCLYYSLISKISGAHAVYKREAKDSY